MSRHQRRLMETSTAFCWGFMQYTRVGKKYQLYINDIYHDSIMIFSSKNIVIFFIFSKYQPLLLLLFTYFLIRAYLTQKRKVKEVNLYSAFIVVPHTQGAQVRITQCYLQITPYLPLPRKHSPDGASPD